MRALTHWTSSLRAAIRRQPGHESLMNALRRAAFTNTGPTPPLAADDDFDEHAIPAAEPRDLLLVHCGVDPTRPLTAQGDAFWWGSSGFARLNGPYGRFQRVIRGFDPGHGGVTVGRHTVTLDGGCGFGGPCQAARQRPGQ